MTVCRATTSRATTSRATTSRALHVGLPLHDMALRFYLGLFIFNPYGVGALLIVPQVSPFQAKVQRSETFA